jgi:hypothetical protein
MSRVQIAHLRVPIHAFLLFVLLAVLACAAAEWHTSPDQWKEPRLYHRPFEEQFASRIALEHCSMEAVPGRELSPNHAYWFALIRPDQTKNGPWDSDILVFTERESLLRIRLRDILECHEVGWVNEKLLRIRVWWGRICATDLIVDVEQEQIIYKEMVWDGVIPFQQFQEVIRQSQPAGASNRSQPVSLQTNRTSVAAGSGR